MSLKENYKSWCKRCANPKIPAPNLKKSVDVNSKMPRKQMIFRGKVVENYFIDQYGYIISDKKRLLGKYRSFVVSGQSKYPQLILSIDGKKVSTSVHRVVCETFHPFQESYPGISKKDWNKTPISVKQELLKNMQVNHIDGNELNFHPSNLEWVTQIQNIHHYQKNLRK